MFFRKFRKGINERLLSDFLAEGFHGDKHLLQFVDSIMSNCNFFIETGANVGSTLAYVARTYPNIQCFSCEPDKASFEEAVKNTSSFSKVHIYNMLSQEFMEVISSKKELFDEDVFFWLDAHGYGFEWPLREELSVITKEFNSAYILIDDFRVPGLDCFGYDKYGEQICSFDYVKNALNPTIGYNLYYPNYTEKTSKHHSLRGWGLIEYGHSSELVFPENLKGKVGTPIRV